MKHATSRILVLGLLAAWLPAVLSACASSRQKTVPGADTEAVTDDLRAHYDVLVIELRTELADLRSEAYISAESLQARIEALEAALESLGIELPDADASATDTAGDSPTTAQPSHETEATTDTDADADQNAAVSALGLIYTVSEGKATVTGYHPDPAQATVRLVIPDSLGGYPVIAIADNAFAGVALESVTLPATVTRLGWFSFAGCPNLRTVTLPASVEYIGYGAFDGCSRLTLYCAPGSYAARYAAAAAIPYEEV